MKRKAQLSSSASHSEKVIKRVSDKEIALLNKKIEPMIKQNRLERIASERAIAGSVYGRNN